MGALQLGVYGRRLRAARIDLGNSAIIPSHEIIQEIRKGSEGIEVKGIHPAISLSFLPRADFAQM
jgi:hypothetical protein